MTDPQTQALHRLLAVARKGEQSNVDAIVALSQRTVFVVPWPGGVEGYRTLVNSDGLAALPIFTSRGELEEASRRFGWLEPNGEPNAVEIGARAAFAHMLREDLRFLIVDIAAAHSLEIERAEIEPLTTAAARKDSFGPYAAAGKISSTIMRAVRTPPPPSSQDVVDPIIPPASATPSNARVERAPSAPPQGFTISDGSVPPTGVTFGGGSSATLSPLGSAPSDELYDALSEVLRGYPEVEWASLCNAAQGPIRPVPTVGVRLDASFRERVGDIIGALCRAGSDQGASLDVLLLDDPATTKAAREIGIVFYPWRKK